VDGFGGFADDPAGPFSKRLGSGERVEGASAEFLRAEAHGLGPFHGGPTRFRQRLVHVVARHVVVVPFPA
jgi:hypothetical protein